MITKDSLRNLLVAMLGLEIGRRVRIVVHGSFAGAFAKDGAPNKAQRGELLGDVGDGD
jgi:hypothetical protein